MSIRMDGQREDIILDKNENSMQQYAIKDGKRIKPLISGDRAKCPACGGDVVAKCGSVNIWHWAHLSGHSCNPNPKAMTMWHKHWQNHWSQEEQEIYTKIEGGSYLFADVKTKDGITIEFQHSPISAENITKRETTYGDMVWVLDGSKYNFKPTLSIPTLDEKIKVLENIFYNNISLQDEFEDFKTFHDAACFLGIYKPNKILIRPGDLNLKSFVLHSNKTIYIDHGEYLYKLEPKTLKLIPRLEVDIKFDPEAFEFNLNVDYDVENVRLAHRVHRSNFIKEYGGAVAYNNKDLADFLIKRPDQVLKVEQAYRSFMDDVSNLDKYTHLTNALRQAGFNKGDVNRVATELKIITYKAIEKEELYSLNHNITNNNEQT